MMTISYLIPFLMVISALLLYSAGPFGIASALLIIANIVFWIGILAKSLGVAIFAIILFIIAHLVLWRFFKYFREETGIDAFGTASIFMLLSAIFFIGISFAISYNTTLSISLGGVFAILGWVFAAVGFAVKEERGISIEDSE